MASFIKFLSDLGFGDVIKEQFSIEDSDRFDIEGFGDNYRKNIDAMKDEFDDSFIVDCFLSFNTVLMRGDFCQMLEMVKNEFGTDMWGTLIAYEWTETGNSSIMELMDSLEVGRFESELANACETARSVWINDYGDGDL